MVFDDYWKFSKFDSEWNSLLKEAKNVFEKETNILNGPKYKIVKEGDSYNIAILVPGYKKENFNISVQDGILKVSYVKKDDETNIFDNVNSFEQSYKLTGKEDLNNITTKLESGILMISFPKKDEFIKKMVIDIK